MICASESPRWRKSLESEPICSCVLFVESTKWKKRGSENAKNSESIWKEEAIKRLFAGIPNNPMHSSIP